MAAAALFAAASAVSEMKLRKETPPADNRVFVLSEAATTCLSSALAEEPTLL